MYREVDFIFLRAGIISLASTIPNLWFEELNFEVLTANAALLPVKVISDDDADECMREEFLISFVTSVRLLRLERSLKLLLLVNLIISKFKSLIKNNKVS